jgi:hypothetical protein
MNAILIHVPEGVPEMTPCAVVIVHAGVAKVVGRAMWSTSDAGPWLGHVRRNGKCRVCVHAADTAALSRALMDAWVEGTTTADSFSMDDDASFWPECNAPIGIHIGADVFVVERDDSPPSPEN